ASPLFVAAVTASAWLGGPGCGLLATVLATLALDAVMGSAWPSFALTEEAIARLAVFVFVALFVSALDHARRRAESARAVLLERVDLGGVVAAATDALAMTATTRGIKVVTNVAGCPPVQGDAARLQQVVSNLLGNALKHSDCGTTVHVDVDALGDRARIVVRD